MTARAQVELPVIRYKPSGYSVGMRADGEGRYVDYFDYAALVARLAESEARAEGLPQGDDLDGFDAIARDAARYRALRELLCRVGSRLVSFSGATPDSLDAAIDAAIAQEAEREAASAATRC